MLVVVVIDDEKEDEKTGEQSQETPRLLPTFARKTSTGVVFVIIDGGVVVIVFDAAEPRERLENCFDFDDDDEEEDAEVEFGSYEAASHLRN